MHTIDGRMMKEYLRQTKKLVELLFERRHLLGTLCPELFMDDDERRETLRIVATVNDKLHACCNRLEALELQGFGVSQLLRMSPVPVPVRCAVTLLFAARLYAFRGDLNRVADIVTCTAGNDPFILWELRNAFAADGTIGRLCDFSPGKFPGNLDNRQVAMKEEHVTTFLCCSNSPLRRKPQSPRPG